MLPILLGAIVGYAVAFIVDLITGTVGAASGSLINYSAFTGANFVVTPHITFPSFTSDLTFTAIFGIGIMAIATSPSPPPTCIKSASTSITWPTSWASRATD